MTNQLLNSSSAFAEEQIQAQMKLMSIRPGEHWKLNVSKNSWVYDTASNNAAFLIAHKNLKSYLATLTPSELKARELQQADPKGWALAQREQAAAKSVQMYNAQKTVKPNKK